MDTVHKVVYFPYVIFNHESTAVVAIGLLWTSDRLVSETSHWQLTTLPTDRHTKHPAGDVTYHGQNLICFKLYFLSFFIFILFIYLFYFIFFLRIEAAEMKLLRPLAGYTLYDHKTNNSIRKELRITSILDKIDEYRKKWLLHVHIQRMPQNRIPLKSYNYRMQGRRSIGRPKKRWREQL